MSKTKCWNCGKVGHFRRDYKEDKNKDKQKKFVLIMSLKTSQEDGGDAFVEALATHAGQTMWLIDFRASFHMNYHWYWFLVYEKYDGGYVLVMALLST